MPVGGCFTEARIIADIFVGGYGGPTILSAPQDALRSAQRRPHDAGRMDYARDLPTDMSAQGNRRQLCRRPRAPDKKINARGDLTRTHKKQVRGIQNRDPKPTTRRAATFLT